MREHVRTRITASGHFVISARPDTTTPGRDTDNGHEPPRRLAQRSGFGYIDYHPTGPSLLRTRPKKPPSGINLATRHGGPPAFPYFFRTGKKKAPSVAAKCLFFLPNLVGAIGLEPTTPTMSR
jgi:hypothetical protein